MSYAFQFRVGSTAAPERLPVRAGTGTIPSRYTPATFGLKIGRERARGDGGRTASRSVGDTGGYRTMARQGRP